MLRTAVVEIFPPANANARARRRTFGSLLWGSALCLVLLAVVPLVALAARPQAVELRGHGGGLGQIAVVPLDDGTGYVAAERLAAVLKGTWKAKGTRGATLTVGSRSAQFTRNDARVVVGGTAMSLAAPVRLGASGWLVPEDFLGKALARLAPGVTSARVPPPTAASVKPAATPVKAVARPPGPGVAFGDLRLRSYPTFTRIVLETAGSITYVVDPASGGAVRVRLRGLHVSGPHAREVDDGLVKALRLEAGDGEATLRVTLDGDAGDVQHYALLDPFRVVIDIYRPKEPTVPGPRGGPVAAPLQLIVLDAGHGGHDPGATGPSGLTEKEVVLDVTRRVARMVEESRLGVKVALTRSTDVFVPLRDRTNFANKQRADLFLSIHANAHPRSVSEGVETYFLSSEATDNEARQVAAIENGVVQLESQGTRPKTDALKSILWDLAQSEFQQESSVFAEIVQDSMTRSLQLVNRGVKQAGFYVLGGAAMPAILLEIGFLTNPKEEKKLSSGDYRESVARAILAGITDYKRRYDQRMRTVRSEPGPRRPEPARVDPPAAGRGSGAPVGGAAGGDEPAAAADAVAPRVELPPLRRDPPPARSDAGARPAVGAPASTPRPAGVAPRPPAGLE